MTTAKELLNELSEEVSRIETQGILKDLLTQMRKAINDNDRKAEAKFRSMLDKEAVKLAKPMIKQVFSDLKKQTSALEKKLSKETGGKWEIFWSGTPTPEKKGGRFVQAGSDLVVRADFLPE